MKNITENKKAQWQLFAGLTIWPIVAILVFGVIAFFMFGSFITHNLIALIGAAIIVLALVFGLKDGNFNRTRGNFMLIFVVIGVFLVLGQFIFGATLQTTFNGVPEVYYPQYGHMQCQLASANYVLYEKTSQTSALTIKCGDNMNAYTDSCVYQVQIKSTNWWDIFSKIKFQKCDNSNNCIDVSGVTPIQGDYFSVASVYLDTNRDGYLDTADGNIYSTIKITPSSGLFSSTTYDVRVIGNAYKLYDTQGNNYVTTYSQGCNLGAAPSSLHETNNPTKVNYQDSSSQIPFGGVVNYVWGMNKGITSNVIQHNNKWVYIEKSGFYDNVLQTPDGYSYADWQNPIPDVTIACVPSNIFNCNADATIRTTPSQNVTGQDCSLIRGVNPTDYLKAATGQCCQFSCVNNKIQASNCQTCAVCNSGFIYDPQTNTCVNPTDTGNQNGNNQCKWYQDSVPETKDYGLFGWRHLFNNPIVSEATCKTATWVYFAMLISGVVVIVIFYLLLIPVKGKRRK